MPIGVQNWVLQHIFLVNFGSNGSGGPEGVAYNLCL